MTPARRVLGQAIPSGGVETDLYTVGAGTQTVISNLFACNEGTVATTFRAGVMPGGITSATKHYFAFDVGLEANETLPLAQGVTMFTGDVLRVQPGNSNVAFGLFGEEQAYP